MTTPLVAVVLAAGAARRFGGDKLSASFRGEPLLHHAIRAARAAPVERVIVVCGDRVDFGDWPAVPPIERVCIASTALSESLQAGVAAAGEVTGVFVFLGDMPLIPHDVAARLAAVLDDRFAAVPRHAGKNGHPVLLAARAFPEIARLAGDEGAGRLLKQRDDLAFVEVADDGILLDVDRTEDLTRLQARR
ncbi:nucleotidyltransferase family protein [Novosphingobium sp. PS1R-30]|uniref:Nucleotidyltransferase family protein n=1 Tax=Novosphingobium anseongense TaxID=3133436 RepID=A0ABU8RXU4_9SPHN